MYLKCLYLWICPLYWCTVCIGTCICSY